MFFIVNIDFKFFLFWFYLLCLWVVCWFFFWSLGRGLLERNYCGLYRRIDYSIGCDFIYFYIKLFYFLLEKYLNDKKKVRMWNRFIIKDVFYLVWLCSSYYIFKDFFKICNLRWIFFMWGRWEKFKMIIFILCYCFFIFVLKW